MEFPNLGERCSWSHCKTLDFLPFICSYCNQTFCKDHFNQNTHECESYKLELSKQNLVVSFVCSIGGCTTCSPVEMPCQKCQKHFCLVHRYHDCFDKVENIEEKKRQWNEPKKQFAESVKTVQNSINEKIKKAVQDPKKQATALKIQLMRLKGKATGTSSIPVNDRIYFLILLPKGSKTKSNAIYVSRNWSIGKVIDSVSSICNVINRNNEMNSPKLRLFKMTDGCQISVDTSVKIFDLIGKNVIANGETLILEYISPTENLSEFELPNFQEYNDTV